MKYLHQPDIDPVLIHLFGPFSIRWYSLLYVGGFVVGRWILRKLAREDRFEFTEEQMDQYILWLLIGAVVGARVFYCVVYDPSAFFRNPFYVFMIHKGGLSFHGGLLGTLVAALIFSRKHSIPFWNLADAMALATPTGLAMGRLGNFINGELWGRTTDVPWAMIFKTDPTRQPRHPSQLYEFFLEGVVLFIILWALKPKLRRDGDLTIVFLIGYTSSRFIVEIFRQPDAHLGFLLFGLTMGQILSLLMLIISVAVGVQRWRKASTE